MAVEYASHSATTATASQSVVITKPTGLAAGDLMIAHIGKRASGGSPTIDTLSGWTSLENAANGNIRVHVQYKIASAGDASATDFTFTGGGSGTVHTGGTIYRITGQATVTVIDASADLTTWTGTSANLAIGVTPSRASDLLLILTGSGEGNSGQPNTTTYAIATSNPSWTEDYDTSIDVGGSAYICNLTGAHATRPEVTATGNVSFAVSPSRTDGLATIIAIGNTVSATTTLDVATVTSSAPNPSFTGGATATLDVATLAASAPDFSQSGQAPWSSQQKGAAPTWTATSKS